MPLALLMVAGCGSDAVSVPRPDVPDVIEVTSAAFGDGRHIPRDHTCEGRGRFPPLVWDGFPGGAVSAAVVVTDPDAPDGVFVHRVVYGLPPGSGGLAGSDLPDGAREADNSGGDPGWYPPCPPSGTHRYQFTVYALAGRVSAGSTQAVLDEIDRLAVASGTLTGLVRAE